MSSAGPCQKWDAPPKMGFNVGAPEGERRTGTSLAEINIIPLVDVVLVLLLIFMLTAPMMYRGIDVNLPRAAAKPTAVEERMVLTLTKDRALYLNDKRIAPGTLDTSLRAAFQNRTDKTLYLKADSGLAYGAVIETMDQVRRAGIERLGMVTEPAKER
jgi:biopolymer transport protein TolR